VVAVSVSALMFVVPGDPVPKARPRTVRTKNGRRRTYTPEKTLAAERAVAAACRKDCKPTVSDDAEYSVVVWFFCKTLRRSDVDNLAKTVLDGLNGVVWKDDSQVTDLEAHIVRGCAEPRTKVTIREKVIGR